MEPRWNKEWLALGYMRYVGDTPEADLWVVFHRDGMPLRNVASLRVAIGEDDTEWDWFRWDMHTGLHFRGGYAKNNAVAYVNNPDNKKLIETYLRLFVPELTVEN